MTSLTITLDEDIVESILKIGESQSLSLEDAASYLLDRTLFGVTRRINVCGEDYKPQSVMVMVDETEDNVLKKYRCENCGNTVFEYCGATKLTAHGQYDRDNEMVNGEVVPIDTFGRPTRIACQGRIIVEYKNGRIAKVRCGYKYYKLKA